ncbi:MAG: hypothetical protein AAB887_01140 [Patescibacteria group bacterium]
MGEPEEKSVEVKPLASYSEGEREEAVKKGLHFSAEREAARVVAELSSDQRGDQKEVAKAIARAAYTPGGSLGDDGVARAMALKIAEVIRDGGLEQSTGEKILSLAGEIEARAKALVQISVPAGSVPKRDEMVRPADIAEDESMRDYLRKPLPPEPAEAEHVEGEWREVASDEQDNVRPPVISVADVVVGATLAEAVDAAQRKGGKKTRPAESPEPEQKPAAGSGEVRETKREAFDWEKNEAELMKIVDKEKGGRPFSSSRAAELTGERDAYWEEHKGEHITAEDKNAAGNLIDDQVRRYDSDGLVPGAKPGDPLQLFLEDVDRKIGVYTNGSQKDPVKASWWRGVRVNVEQRCLRAELSLRTKIPGGEAEEVGERIKELGIESKYLVWGRNKDATKGRWNQLAARHTQWLMENDPGLKDGVEARKRAEGVGGQRFGGGFENFPVSPPPAHYVAIFREGRYGSFEKQWGDKVKFLSVLNEDDRLAWCYANMGAFANGVIQTKDWKAVVDLWLGDIKDSANLVKAGREKMVGIKETEKDLRAMMALSASARAMEGSAGSAATYVKLLTVDRDGDLDKQDTWAEFLLHDDPEKYWRVVSQPLVKHYYYKILAQAGISLDNESGQTIDGKLRKVSSFKVNSDTALSSELFGFLRQTEGAKYKGGFEPYISDGLLVTDDEAFVSAQAELGVDESARWSAARLACDAFMVDKLTRWESETRKDKVKYPDKTNIKPYVGWGGDPLILVLQPSFLSRVIKKVYSKEDKAIMDMTDNAFRPVDIFDGLKGTDVEPLPISMVGHLKGYARYNDALWQFLGGSRAAGIPQWTNDTMAKTLPAIGELLDQVYGGAGKKDVDGKTDNTGKQVVGAMMARILECKALATAVESARPGFKDNLRILFNVGDPKEARPFLEVEKFIWGPDLDSKKGFLASLVGGRTRFILKDNKYGAETALKNTWEILNSNDQDPKGRGKAATLNRVGFLLDVAQALAKNQKR